MITPLSPPQGQINWVPNHTEILLVPTKATTYHALIHRFIARNILLGNNYIEYDTRIISRSILMHDNNIISRSSNYQPLLLL